MMIDIGICMHNSEYANRVTEFLQAYLHCPPCHKHYGESSWYLPYMNITVFTSEHARGLKFDLVYYDEIIPEDIRYMVIFPMSAYSRPRPIKELIGKIPLKYQNLNIDFL